MNYAAQFGKKINRIRKKNWSAPTIMAAFILTCMIIIYSFESLGLTNKEKNLDYRISSPEKLIKVVSNEVKINKNADMMGANNSSESFGSTYFKFLTQKDKEKHLMEMKSILMEAAEHQYNYELSKSFMEENHNTIKREFKNNFYRNFHKCHILENSLVDDYQHFIFDI